MSDRSDPPEYDWLYGGKQPPPQQDPAQTRRRTRRMTRSRPA